jgi:hypothetical protein
MGKHMEFRDLSLRFLGDGFSLDPRALSLNLSVLILYFPMKNEPMSARCFHVASSSEGLGFSSVDLAAAKAKYDPKVGLGLRMPFTFYVDGIKNNKVTATVFINQDKETVTVK